MNRFPTMRAVASAVLLAATAGCIGDGVVGPSSIYGSYELKTINGNAPPVRTDSTAAGVVTVTRQSITVFKGGTYTDSLFVSTKPAAGTAVTSVSVEQGVYATLGTSFTFTFGSRQRFMNWVEGRLTHIEAGVTRVYSL